VIRTVKDGTLLWASRSNLDPLATGSRSHPKQRRSE
jgi:hypothetical protein